MEKLRAGAGDSASSTEIFATTLADLRRSIAELNAEAARFLTSEGPAGTAPPAAEREPN
jgi:hypothetical protein